MASRSSPDSSGGAHSSKAMTQLLMMSMCSNEPKNEIPKRPPGRSTRRTSANGRSRPQIPLNEVTTSNSSSPHGRSEMSPTRKSPPGVRSDAIVDQRRGRVEPSDCGTPPSQLNSRHPGTARDIEDTIVDADVQTIEHVEVDGHAPRIDEGCPVNRSRSPRRACLRPRHHVPFPPARENPPPALNQSVQYRSRLPHST